MTPENINIMEIRDAAKLAVPDGKGFTLSVSIMDVDWMPAKVYIATRDNCFSASVESWRDAVNEAREFYFPTPKDLNPGVVFTGLESAIEESAVAA